MKFLLTSNGLSNKSIAKALFELVGKSPNKIKISFIPTAMNVGTTDKSWFIDDLYNIRIQNVEEIDIVDISALPQESWLPRLEKADILFFGGGNCFHLMKCIKESGLQEMLPKLLETRVWAGISAGSMVTNPSLALSSKDRKLYYERKYGEVGEAGLGYVDLYVRSHYKSSDFPHVQDGYLREIAREIKEPIYALDDNSALKIVDGEIEIISEGDYLILNQ